MLEARKFIACCARPCSPSFLTVFVDVLGLTLMLPLLPFYAEHYGATPLIATTLLATYAAAQLIPLDRFLGASRIGSVESPCSS